MGTRRQGQHVRRRLATLCILTLVLIGLSTAYVAWRATQTRPTPPPTPQPAVGANALDEILNGPHLVFLDTPDYSHRHVAVAPIDDPQRRYVTGTTCERVYASRTGGLCLGVEGTVAYSYNARSFDARLRPGTTFELQGVPSRVRVTSDARYGSATVFVAGDSYGAPFSTRTVLFDLSAGHDIGSLEDFSVFKDGVRFESPDFNFWGTTFSATGHRFYATLGSRDSTYLVGGDLERREAHVLRENVECPSLSPDGTRIAYKKRVDNIPGNWRLAVLDLSTLQDTLLNNETRSVDDQVEWLDDTHVLYGLAEIRQPGQLATDIWVASTDANEQPRIYVSDALSPAVVR
jgi:hypothetical protein